LVRQRQLPIIGDGAGVWSWVHVDDAAGATVAALERGEAGLYNVVDDDPARGADWLPYLAPMVGGEPPLRGPCGGPKCPRDQPARSYTWWRPPSTGRTRIGPVGERDVGRGVSSRRVRWGRWRL